MYRKTANQISLADFKTPFGVLDPSNRWVKKSEMIPWDRIEDKYADLFESQRGAGAKPLRMALGALLIKSEMTLSDEAVVQNVLENPYMQFFIGLPAFTTKAPFSSTSLVYFRKRLTPEVLSDINDIILGLDDDTYDNGDGTPEELDRENNKGTLMLDATCVPSDITYPTDSKLLNKAREELEGMIDTLHPHTGEKKPRTYRRRARKEYLSFSKQRKPRKGKIRKIIGKLLGYIRRDLSTIERMTQKIEDTVLDERQMAHLKTIKTLYDQQEMMYQTRTHQVENRIVSISQPYVRPIVRGKAGAAVEFGAKVSISLVDGFAFIDKLDWDAYNEANLLKEAAESYKKRYGYYPKAILADKIYRNKDNRSFCKLHGIRLSGPKLGRPKKGESSDPYAKQDSAARNWVESKFGEGKVCKGLSRILMRLQETSESTIHLAFIAMNLNRKMRVLFARFGQWIALDVFVDEGLLLGGG